MSLIFNEWSLTVVLFELNNKSFNLCEHEAKNCDLDKYLLIRSFFTKIILNENCERLYLCSSTCIKIIFIIYFIINDDRLIINLLSHLIVIFDLFRNERDDFESEKNLLLKFESKSF